MSDDETSDPFAQPRTVKPRARNHKRLSVIAISNDQWLDEAGNVGPTGMLLGYLPDMTSTLFVKMGSADFVAWLDSCLSGRSDWQWRASTTEREIVRHDNKRTAARISTVIHYFGFKNGNYHRIIDPVVMYGHALDNIYPGPEGRLVKLLQWGVELRDFCHSNGLEVRPTIGGISAQFLRDKRFYPNARRKVPAATNETVRTRLPGNHYLLAVTPRRDREFRAWYIDQSRAHHYHARTTPLPNADSLYAYGFFQNCMDNWCPYAFKKTIPGFYGLYCLDVDLPVTGHMSHWLKKPGHAFVYSNELQHLLDNGYTVKGVYAAWGSRHKDTGLAKYAKWAESQLDFYNDAPWLKPLLLSAYGVLATKPRYAEAVFKLAKSGEDVTLVTGNNELSGKLVKATRKLEPQIANVLHRGMIEAATRSESIGLAQWLAATGHRILSIYADAVIVEDDGTQELPLNLPEPWRVKSALNHLQFINQQAFISGEMTKLPGVSQEMRKLALTPQARPTY